VPDTARRQQLQALTLSCRVRELTGGERDSALQSLVTRHPQLAAITSDPDAAVLALEVRRYQLLTGALDMFVHEVA